MSTFRERVVNLLEMAKLTPEEEAQVKAADALHVPAEEVAAEIRQARREKSLERALRFAQVSNDPDIVARAKELLASGVDPEKAVDQASQEVTDKRAAEEVAAKASVIEKVRKAREIARVPAPNGEEPKP